MVVALAHFVCLWACAACTRPEPSQSSPGLTGPHSNQNFSVKHQNTNPIVNLTDFQIPVFPVNLERADHLQHQHDATFHGEPHLATYHTGESLFDASRGDSLPDKAAAYLDELITAHPNEPQLGQIKEKAEQFYKLKPKHNERKNRSQNREFDSWKTRFLDSIKKKKYGTKTTLNGAEVTQSLKQLTDAMDHFPDLDLMPSNAVIYLNSLIENYQDNNDLTKLKTQAELFYKMREETETTLKKQMFENWETFFLLGINGKKYGGWLENLVVANSVEALTYKIDTVTTSLITTLNITRDKFESVIAELPPADLPDTAKEYLTTLIDKNPSHQYHLKQLKEKAELFYKMATKSFNEDLKRAFTKWNDKVFLPKIKGKSYGSWLDDGYLKTSLNRLETDMADFKNTSD